LSSKNPVFEVEWHGFPPTRCGLRRFAHAIFFEECSWKFSTIFWIENKQKPPDGQKPNWRAATKYLVSRDFDREMVFLRKRGLAW